MGVVVVINDFDVFSLSLSPSQSFFSEGVLLYECVCVFIILACGFCTLYIYGVNNKWCCVWKGGGNHFIKRFIPWNVCFSSTSKAASSELKKHMDWNGRTDPWNEANNSFFQLNFLLKGNKIKWLWKLIEWLQWNCYKSIRCCLPAGVKLLKRECSIWIIQIISFLHSVPHIPKPKKHSVSTIYPQWRTFQNLEHIHTYIYIIFILDLPAQWFFLSAE